MEKTTKWKKGQNGKGSRRHEQLRTKLNKGQGTRGQLELRALFANANRTLFRTFLGTQLSPNCNAGFLLGGRVLELQIIPNLNCERSVYAGRSRIICNFFSNRRDARQYAAEDFGSKLRSICMFRDRILAQGAKCAVRLGHYLNTKSHAFQK